jgi:myo-inositol-1(or 4)-monophosphatase
MTVAQDQQRALATAVGELLRDSLRDIIPKARGQVSAKETQVAGDVVTDTDFALQETLQAGLRRLLPEAGFIGEEGFEAMQVLGDQPHWIVDPLDGTLNYACDLPFFGASIALIVEGMPVVGVVYDYGADTVFEAVAGQGARCNGAGMLWDAAMAQRSPIGISSGFLALMKGPEAARYNPDWLGSRFRIFGSQAVQLCWAAAGRLRLNINVEAKLWDDAAGILICQEAGADYAALAADPVYPLSPSTPALAGQSLFSISGAPDLVDLCRRDFVKG